MPFISRNWETSGSDSNTRYRDEMRRNMLYTLPRENCSRSWTTRWRRSETLTIMRQRVFLHLKNRCIREIIIFINKNILHRSIIIAFDDNLNFVSHFSLLWNSEVRARNAPRWNFFHEGKIPATLSAGTADRVIIDRAMKNYTRGTSRLTSACRIASHRIASRFAGVRAKR